MTGRSMWFEQAFAVCAKDLRIEFRERTAVSAVVLFSVTSLVVLGFALAGNNLAREVSAPLLWVVMFYAAFSGLAHVFTVEEDGGTSMTLQLAADPTAVYFGKLLYNLALLSCVALIAVPLFLVISAVPVPYPWKLIAVVSGGSFALASAATMTGVIVAKARGRGALFGALGFPMVLPLLIMAVVATRNALNPETMAWEPLRDVGGLIAYGTMMGAASFLVFPYVWESN